MFFHRRNYLVVVIDRNSKLNITSLRCPKSRAPWGQKGALEETVSVRYYPHHTQSYGLECPPPPITRRGSAMCYNALLIVIHAGVWSDTATDTDSPFLWFMSPNIHLKRPPSVKIFLARKVNIYNMQMNPWRSAGASHSLNVEPH